MFFKIDLNLVFVYGVDGTIPNLALKGGDYMLMPTKIQTPVEKAEKLLPQIDSIFCGTLSGKEAREVIREGESVLRELAQLNGEASIDLIESLRSSIRMAKLEIENEPQK